MLRAEGNNHQARSPQAPAVRIAETEAERARYEVSIRQSAITARQRMTGSEIRAVVDELADVARVLRGADPDDKSEIFRRLGLKVTYHPGRQLVAARVEPAKYGFFDGVRGPSRNLRTWPSWR